jgi:pimeloyl-ACP methyl ester carboxylesterase
MSTYLFVAGAWHGSWCWSAIAPLLQAAGHRVLTPDLIGMSGGEAPPIEAPLATWADQIADMLHEETAPVILVGHSRAGLVISEVAERVPDKVERLVYLCAFMLKDGQTLNEVAQQADNLAEFAEAVAFRDDGTVVLTGGWPRLFYNRTPETFVQVARQNMVAEPAAAFVTPVRLSKERFGTVPRTYIECSEDRAIPLTTQRAMQEAMPGAHVERLESDHSPFFSMPAELVRCLERLRGAA